MQSIQQKQLFAIRVMATIMEALSCLHQFLGLVVKIAATNPPNKTVNRTFFASFRFSVAAPLFRKTPLHKKCPLQWR